MTMFCIKLERHQSIIFTLLLWGVDPLMALMAEY
jgi:hypothetical protein